MKQECNIPFRSQRFMTRQLHVSLIALFLVAGQLQAKQTYAIWLNAKGFTNFKDTGGRSAVPYLLVFQAK
jgi:hypothetical protein|tara:strand:- start:119 stop:328 length:210 start_codon:yes stop_codon:yes gene_type:complete